MRLGRTGGPCKNSQQISGEDMGNISTYSIYIIRFIIRYIYINIYIIYMNYICTIYALCEYLSEKNGKVYEQMVEQGFSRELIPPMEVSNPPEMMQTSWGNIIHHNDHVNPGLIKTMVY